jgi:hypothetical protein
MTERAQQLHATADRQIAELIVLLGAAEQATLRLPCAGREKLGDGTIAALLGHTADNFQRIAAFVVTSDGMSATHAPPQHGGHRIPRLLRALRHGPTGHDAHAPGQHGNSYSADTLDVDRLIQQLLDARAVLARIGELTDMQLDAIPPKDSFRFCDGHRTLEQVLDALLRHQNHQVETLKAAIA